MLLHKIKILASLFLSLPALATTASAANRTIDFQFDTATKYSESIARIRQNLSEPMANLNGIRRTLHDKGYAIVSFPGYKGDVDIVLNNRDLYVVGFTSGNTFYRLNDSAFNWVTIPKKTTVQLPLKPDYRNLESGKRQTRAQTVINSGTLTSSLDFLKTFDAKKSNQDQLAKAIVTMAVGISESSRFINITSQIFNSWSRSTALGTTLQAETNEWKQISKYAQQLSDNPKSTTTLEGVLPITLTRANLNTVLFVALNASAAK